MGIGIRLSAAALLVTLGASAVRAEGEASFDCASATTAAERGICASQELAKLDGVLGAIYARAKVDAPATLDAGQRAWIARRDDCWTTGAPEACARREYVKRIAVLAADFPAAMGDAPVVGPIETRCETIADPIRAVFVNTDPGFVSLVWGDMALVLDQTMSGSGARYSDEDDGGRYVFWEKGREATFEGPALTAPAKCTLAE